MSQADGATDAMWRPPHGAVDATYATAGRRAWGEGTGNSDVRSVAAQTDRKLVMAGSAHIAGDRDFQVARLQENGGADLGFAGDGTTTVDVTPAGNDDAYDIAVQGDGKIVVVGGADTGAIPDFIVMRFLPNGTLDSTFDGPSGSGNGIVALDPTGESDIAYSVAIQPDGKIIAAGSGGTASPDMAVVRLNTSGTYDTSFDTDGIQRINFFGQTDKAADVTLQNDGKIVLAGQAASASYFEMAVARLSPNGALDTSFNTTGKARVQIPGISEYAESVFVHSNGTIYAGGRSDSGTGVGLIARFTAAGVVDTTFAGDGVAEFQSTKNIEHFTTLHELPDGRMLGSGYSYQSGDSDFLIAVTDVAGPDLSHGVGGLVEKDVTANESAIDSVITTDGMLVIAGSSSGAALASRFDTTTIADWVGGAADWNDGSNAFGACISAVTAGASATWQPELGCPDSDDPWWNAVPDTPTKIAYTTVSDTTAATVALRFGIRTANNQPPGRYIAPVQFNVIAPNVP
jgi:uncharacterized delta-60 repeat protein